MIALPTAGALAGSAVVGPGATEASAAPKNLISGYETLRDGCPGFGLTTTVSGFSLGYGGGVQCSISTPWGVPTIHSAQGRLTYTAPAGTRIAAWRDLDLQTRGLGAPPVSTEVYVNDLGGEYQVRNWNQDTANRTETIVANHPDGAYSMFFLKRSHGDFTSHSGYFRHTDFYGGSIDLYDLERPTISGVSVDGGSTWSSNPTRTVRMTLADNLGAAGIDRTRIQVGATILHEDRAASPGARAYSVSLAGLPDGSHALGAAVAPTGSGDLGWAWGPLQTVRLDRTAPQLSSTRAVPSVVTGDLRFGVEASDAHSGIRHVQIQRDIGGSWETVKTITSGFGDISLDTTTLADGAHAFRATATDNVGLTTSRPLGTITVQNRSNPVEPGAGGDGPSGAQVPAPPRDGPQPRAGARLVLDGPAALRRQNQDVRGVRVRAHRAVPLLLVRYPKPGRATLSATFAQADGTPIPGHPVALVEAGVVRAWARTNDAGRVSFRFRPLRSGALRLRWAGNDDLDPILARAATKVVGRVGLSSPRTLRPGRPLVVTGRTLPGVRRQLVLLETLNTSRCRAWRHVVVGGRVLSAPTRSARAAASAPERCWEPAAKARTKTRGLFRVRESGLGRPILLNGRRPRSFAYAAYVRVRGVNAVSAPARVMVRG